MDLGQLSRLATTKINVGLINFSNTFVPVGSPVPPECMLGTKPAVLPILRAGGEKESGFAVWLVGKAIVIDEIEYKLELEEGIMAKFNNKGVSPLIQTSPIKTYIATDHITWPIIKRMFYKRN